LLSASAVLAVSPSMTAVWWCLPPLALAVSLQRAAAPSIISAAAPPAERGEALGALDAMSSACRVAVPLLAGLLAAHGGVQMPYAAQSALGALGLAVCAWSTTAATGSGVHTATPPTAEVSEKKRG
jgi:MFS family permease